MIPIKQNLSKNSPKMGNISNLNSFSEVYDDCFSLLVHKAFDILLERQISEDVVQEVFMDLWERRDSVWIDNYMGYLYKAVKYKSYRIKKKLTKLVSYSEIGRQHQNSIVNLNHAYGPIEDSKNTDDRTKNLFNNSIELLPHKCKEVFCMYFFDRLTYKEIAKLCCISTKTVDNQIYQAKKRIKEHFISSHKKHTL